MSEREDKTSRWEPIYPATLHPDVVSECRREWTNGRPWTNIRVLRSDADASENASCAHWEGCKAPVEAVQYNTAFGDPEFYCEGHAVAEQERQVGLYDSEPIPVPEMTEGEREWIRRFLARGKKKQEPESEEFDP